MAWTLVKAGKVVETFSGGEGVTIDGVRHPQQIFSDAWTDDERAAIGLFPVANRDAKAIEFYKPTGRETFALKDGVVERRQEYAPVPIDQAKGRMKTNIQRHAEQLKENYWSKDARATEALRVAVSDVSQGDRDRLKASIGYLDAIDAEAVKRIAEIEAMRDVEDVAEYDWKDGWPLPPA